MSNIQTEREAFWQQYYAGEIEGDSKLDEEPSPFAKEVISNLNSKCSLLEIGCGNGRDACFFASNGVTVVATDVCEAAIKLTGSKLPEDCRAVVASAKCLPDDICVDYAYARFVLHALTLEEQHDLFLWMRGHVKRKIFIETRSVKDPRFGKGANVGNNAYVDTHYRRFMSPADLQAAANEAGLCVEVVEDTTPGSGTDGACVVRATLSIL